MMQMMYYALLILALSYFVLCGGIYVDGNADIKVPRQLQCRHKTLELPGTFEKVKTCDTYTSPNSLLVKTCCLRLNGTPVCRISKFQEVT